jgi:hypothetical protein
MKQGEPAITHVLDRKDAHLRAWKDWHLQISKLLFLHFQVREPHLLVARTVHIKTKQNTPTGLGYSHGDG